MCVLKPPIFREPLNETMRVGSYVIRALGGPISEACVTSLDDNSFRLEIDYDKLELSSDRIHIDKKSNLLTITIPAVDKSAAFAKLVQIAVPSTKRVENLQIDSPLQNRGKLIITGKL